MSEFYASRSVSVESGTGSQESLSRSLADVPAEEFCAGGSSQEYQQQRQQQPPRVELPRKKRKINAPVLIAQKIREQRAAEQFDRIVKKMQNSDEDEVEHILEWDLESATTRSLIQKLERQGFKVIKEAKIVCQGLLIHLE